MTNWDPYMSLTVRLSDEKPSTSQTVNAPWIPYDFFMEFYIEVTGSLRYGFLVGI